MKKLFPILLLAALFASCSKSIIPPCQKPLPRDTIVEIPMTMTLDSLDGMAGVGNLRVANDGNFDWVWLGDGFNQQNKWIFDQHCDHAEAFLKTLHPLDSLWALGKLKFYRQLVTGNLNCKYFGFESIQCNWDKVIKAAYVNGLKPDFIHVFALGKGYGTGNGGIAVLGIGTGQPGPLDYCEYWYKLVRLDAHEDGHAFGLAHALVPTYPPNIMSQATNGGCELGSTYLLKDQPVIVIYVNSRIN